MQRKNFFQGATRITGYKQIRHPGFFEELLKKKSHSWIEEGQATNTDDIKEMFTSCFFALTYFKHTGHFTMERQFKQTVKAHVRSGDNTLIALPCTDFCHK